MNGPSSSARANSYFENPKRDKDVDFTEVLNLKEEFEALKNDMGENMTQTQADFQNKQNALTHYRFKLLMSYFQSINEKGYIEFNKNLMNFCRNSCLNNLEENFTESERKCLKNCSSKYIQQFNVFNTFKAEYENKYTTGIFVFEDKNKEALEKFMDILRINKENSI